MGLSLLANHEDLLGILNIEERYIVPTFQPAYSWRYDQCYQLYTDIFDAHLLNEDYFVGNIILAKGDNDRSSLYVIDGHQRLITFLLLIKTLHIFKPHLPVLSNILEYKSWQGIKTHFRIKTEVFEAPDGIELELVLKCDNAKLKDRFKECKDNSHDLESKFEKNLFYFYEWISFKNKSQHFDLDEFIEYLLTRVYLLTIELAGDSVEEAIGKALTIFDTANGQGMLFQNADIFKEILYKKATNVGGADLFMESWQEITHSAEVLKISTDDIWRYYYYIIRGKNGISTKELGLREFFTNNLDSPLTMKGHKEITADLFKIIEILETIERDKYTGLETSKMFQKLESFSNRYLDYAVVAYLYAYGLESNQSLNNFIFELIKIGELNGSSTKIRFEIFTIIKYIFLGRSKIMDYCSKNLECE